TTGTDVTDGTADEGEDEGEPVAGGTLTLLEVGAVPRTFDPALAPFSRTGPGGATGGVATQSVYDALIWVNYNTNEIIPRIAESVESNDDATVWTITLREGVQFSDGTPYDSAAVAFNW